MTKAHLRQLFLSKRLSLGRSEFWSATEAILEEVKKFGIQSQATVHIFLPLASKNEVDTFAILDYFKVALPDLKVLVPRTDFNSGRFDSIQYDHRLTILRRNIYGIPEPVHGRIADPMEIDIAFVPLIVCDSAGNRVGYGKGFYDRFFKECRADILKIGLSFFQPYPGLITDLNQSDVPLDLCITPSGIIDFHNHYSESSSKTGQ